MVHRVVGVVGMIRIVSMPVIVLVLVDDELGRRHTGAQDSFGVEVIARHREAAERALQLLERKAGIEQRADGHVAGYAGKAVEVQHARH